MLSLTAACSPVLVKSCALLGFKAAFFHASGFCQEKWSFKFKSALNGRCGSMEKDYFNYIKRKRRADAKKDLLKWRSFEIYTNEFDQLYWSCGSKSSSKSQKQRSGGQKWSEGCEETSGHKKRKRCSEANQGASQKEFWNDPFQFIWQSEKSHYNQWWAFAWSSFSQDCRSANNRRSNFTHGFSSGSDSNGSTDSTGKEKVEMEATVGSPSERQSLGLRPTGSLTMEELKKAFRLSALKWHPDRHEGASKVGAEAKFKDCAAAYKSLLTALAKA